MHITLLSTLMKKLLQLLRYNGTNHSVKNIDVRSVIYMNYIWAATLLNFIIYFMAVLCIQKSTNTLFNITLIIFISLYIFIFFIVKFGYFLIARHIFMFTVYAMICFGDHVFGQYAYNVLFYLAFLPTVFNLFSLKREKWLVLFYLVLLLTLVLISELYTYNLFPPGSWAISIEHQMHVINLISAFILCTVYAGFIVLNTYKKHIKLISQGTALQTTLNNATGAIWSFDNNYKLIAANKLFVAFVKQYCHIDKLPLGTDILPHFTMPGITTVFLNLYHKVLQGISIDEELIIDKEIFKIRAVPILNEDGIVEGATFTTHSLTQIKKAKEELIESQKILKQITDTINDVFYLYDIANKKYLFISPNCKEVLGAADSYFYNNGTYTKDFVHIKDRAKMLEANKIVDAGKGYNEEYRIIINGQVKWINEKSFPIKDDAGNTIRNSGVLTDITEQKISSEQLLDTQENFKQITNTINDVVFLYDTVQKKYLFFSPNCHALLGVPDTYFYESNDYTKDFVLEEDSAILNEAYKNLQEKHSYDIEYRALINNEIKWLNEKSFAIENADGKMVKLCGIVTDITNKKIIKENLLRSQENMEEAQSLAQVGSWELMYYEYEPSWSKEMYNIFEMESVKDKMMNEVIKQKLHKDDVKLFDDNIQNVVTNAVRKSVELRVVCKDQSIKYVSAITSPILSAKNKKVIGVRGTVQDITRQKLAENAKSNFLSTMSHEIRTPINGVIGVANLLKEEDLTDIQKEYISTLNFSAQHLLSVVTDILDFSKIESGTISLEKNSFNMEQLCFNIFKLFETKANEKNIDYSFSPCNTGTFSFYGDSVRLSQVLTNLLSNAVKFTNVGSVKFSYKVVAENDDKITTVFVVKDSGIGIALEKQKKIFESFLQADDSVTREYGGTGLGLTICKKLVELQNGTIEVESEKGKGSTFTVTLTFEKHVYHKQNMNTYNKDIDEMDSLNGMKVLVAEDNAINAMVLTRFLKKWNIECPVAANGKIAVEMAEKENFDLILMDLQMPEMDGRTATTMIRTSTQVGLRIIPIVALTADALIESHIELLKNGFNDAVTKPFSPDVLFKVLKKYHSSTIED